MITPTSTLSGRTCILRRKLRNTIFGEIYQADYFNRYEYFSEQRDYTSSRVAVKVFNKVKLNKSVHAGKEENPYNEMAILQFIREYTTTGGHDNVIQSIAVCEDDIHVFLIMEYAGTDLCDIVMSRSSLDEGTARLYFRQMAHGLWYLHSLHLSHRDLSLENVVVDINGICKIIDLGMCIRVDQEDGEVRPMLFQSRWTKLCYRAPEEILELPYDPQTADIWCLGIMLFMMVTGKELIEVPSTYHCYRYKLLCENRWSELLTILGTNSLSSGLFDLLRRLLTIDWTQRISLQEILAHPWMQLPDGVHMPLESELLE